MLAKQDAVRCWRGCPMSADFKFSRGLNFVDRRNQLVHGKLGLHDVDIWQRPDFFLLDFEKANESSEGLGCVPPSSLRWQPPVGLVLKMNVDAALNKSSGQVGLGIVIRNCYGDLVLAVGISSSYVFDVAEAEAKAVLEGVRLASARGLVPLCIESDSQCVVKLCNGISSTRCCLDNIIHDIQVLCRSLDIVSISHVFRGCNSVAHSIAKWALGRNSSTIWFSVFLPWLRKIVLSDVVVFASPCGV
ncbi:hypothetical protein ACOSP7_028196 [Xanthoceras sorbifolium]